jgi:hypothetical protein
MSFPVSPVNGQSATVNNITYTYNSTSNSWRRNTGGTLLQSSTIQEFTAVANTTTFLIAGGYTSGTIQIYANGVQLTSSDFTATNGTSVILGTPRRAGDVIRVQAAQGLIASSQQAYNFTEVTAVAQGQLLFQAGYNPSNVLVHVNGYLVSPTGYTATDGRNIYLTTGTSATYNVTTGTKMAVVSFNSVSISNAISNSGGTINGTLNVVGSLQQNGADLQGFAAAMSVGLGS